MQVAHNIQQHLLNSILSSKQSVQSTLGDEEVGMGESLRLQSEVQYATPVSRQTVCVCLETSGLDGGCCAIYFGHLLKISAVTFAQHHYPQVMAPKSHSKHAHVGLEIERGFVTDNNFLNIHI